MTHPHLEPLQIDPLTYPSAGRCVPKAMHGIASLQHRFTVVVQLRLGFTPISSEDRLSFGSSGNAEAFVVDVHGDTPLGGVSAQGAVPAALSDLLSGSVSFGYGNQTSGPHPPVSRGVLEPFVAACGHPLAQASVSENDQLLRLKTIHCVLSSRTCETRPHPH